MRLLLDSHALLWWLIGDERLSLVARRAISENPDDAHVSAATVWEIAIKHRLGKLPTASAIVDDPAHVIGREGFLKLLISVAHAAAAGRLPLHHSDPFDRMLVAQAMTDDPVLISNEAPFDAYEVLRIW